jgi:Cdc6-like AAA superfamily ATPase
VTLDLSHLAKDVREQAFESSAARIRHVQEARWITHERVQRVLHELEWRFNYPTCSRMPCLLLYGDSGMGKTMAIEKFMRLHPPSYDHKVGITKSPVVIVNMPSSPNERRFFSRVLESLHAPFSPSEGLIALETLAMRVLRRVEPKMLIIDEAHDLLAGSYREQRCALNLLKGLANDLRIPVVAVGTEDARHAIQTDPQVASRFDPLHLARWKESEAFRNFVAAFGKLLPLRKPSAFGQREMVRLLLDRSEGITGRATRLISRAAAEAIQDGSEQVSIERIDEISRRTTIAA